MTAGPRSMDGLRYVLFDPMIRRAKLTVDERDLLQLLACGNAVAGEADCLFDRVIADARKQA